jgi:hypothetical protein
MLSIITQKIPFFLLDGTEFVAIRAVEPHLRAMDTKVYALNCPCGEPAPLISFNEKFSCESCKRIYEVKSGGGDWWNGPSKWWIEEIRQLA